MEKSNPVIIMKPIYHITLPTILPPILLIGLICLILTVTPATIASAQETSAQENDTFIPYFASLRYHKTFVRSGPGRNYPVLFVYNQEHLPLEIINKLDDWLQIRDWTGDQGWILRNQARSRQRYGIVVLEEISMYQQADKTSRKIARLAYEIVGKITQCGLQWCEIDVGEKKGWIRRAGLWGLYPNEIID
ncbi:MAG: hypothetical protein K0U45_10155 [Alphaproteobacteria bacterium]|nr:hypothetical protein [Alphaproteobacteria bacterium]